MCIFNQQYLYVKQEKIYYQAAYRKCFNKGGRVEKSILKAQNILTIKERLSSSVAGRKLWNSPNTA